jgi:hypothetical protein
MGLEFINKTRKTYRTSLERGRQAIETPRLTDRPVAHPRRSFRIAFRGEQKLPAGSRVFIRADHDGVRVLDSDERVVALSVEPPPWLTAQLEASADHTLLGNVERVNPFGRRAYVRLLEEGEAC